MNWLSWLEITDLELRAHLVDEGMLTPGETCAEPDCDEPIYAEFGPCAFCGAALCLDDLEHHEWLHGHRGTCDMQESGD